MGKLGSYWWSNEMVDDFSPIYFVYSYLHGLIQDISEFKFWMTSDEQ